MEERVWRAVRRGVKVSGWKGGEEREWRRGCGGQ